DGSTGNKTETVTSGQKPVNVPTEMKPNTGYTGGAWNTNPAEATITADVTFTFSFTAETTSYTVTYAVANGTWSDGSTGNKTETVTSGQKPVNVPTEMKPNTGYTGGAWNTNPAETIITADVTFTFSFTAEAPAGSYTVTVTNDGHGAAVASHESGAQGTEVTLAATPSDGYKFKEWTVLAGGVTITGNKFTIGTANVEVKAVFEEITYVVTVGTATHGKVTVDKTSAPKDAKVTITISPDSGYVLDKLTVKDPANNEIAVTSNAFTMPACNVTVSATFKAAPGPVTYSITSGANGAWIKGSGLTFSYTAKRSTADNECISHFKGVTIDNNILPITDYTIKSGSTIVTIKAYALQRLSAGVHTVTLWFDDGTVSTFLYIWADPRYPATGDERQTATWAALTGVTFVGMAAVVVLGSMYWKKKKSKSE
ncbi:MAG: hypothetical protein IJJ22_01345, partial [Oscillospiraceae bacterium]|nr:hypothetical protein [Oscillospiraceae bacterium]